MRVQLRLRMYGEASYQGEGRLNIVRLWLLVLWLEERILIFCLTVTTCLNSLRDSDRQEITAKQRRDWQGRHFSSGNMVPESQAR